METQEIRINDKKARIIGMPLIIFLATFLYHRDNFSLYNSAVLTGFFISFLNTLLIWEGTRIILYKARKKYPNVEQTMKRLIYQSLITIIFTFLGTISCRFFCCISKKYIVLKFPLWGLGAVYFPKCFKLMISCSVKKRYSPRGRSFLVSPA